MEKMATIGEVGIKEEIKREPDWKEVRLYGISGIFNDLDTKSKMAFGGYIKVVEEDGDLHGELIDTYGPSEIKGFLIPDTIVFKKEYTLKKRLSDLEYNLKRTTNGHFKGYCSVTSHIFPLISVQLEAELTIFLLDEDAYYVMAGPPTPKEMIKRFYERQ